MTSPAPVTRSSLILNFVISSSISSSSQAIKKVARDRLRLIKSCSAGTRARTTNDMLCMPNRDP